MKQKSLFLILFSLLFLLALSSCSLYLGEGSATSTAAATTTGAVTTTTAVTTAPTDNFPDTPPIVGGIRRADGVVIDGVLDAAYYGSISIGTRYQSDDYLDNPSLIVDPTEAIPMKDIYLGTAERPNTYFTLYLLWGEEEGEPYLYLAAVIHDETPNERSGAYMANANPWLNDALEISYHLGGDAAPVIPAGENTYPTYHNVLVDAREKTVSDHSAEAPNHTAVAAQRSYYFDKIESATARLDDSTYVVEVKIPAYTETHTGKPGVDLAREGGAPLGEGDLVFLCFELLDLVYLPEGYDDTLPEGEKYENEWKYTPLGDWKAFENDLMPYMYCAGNRDPALLSTEGSGPIAFRLSALYAE